jgi:esterase/lipase superfamily enzyme
MTNWKMRAKSQSRRSGRIGAIFCLMVLLVGGCASNDDPSRVLMPTPLALTLGMSHPGTSCLDASSDPEVPVFIISGRNLEANPEGIDPFGNNRSHTPTLAVVKVKIGAGLSEEELYHETVKACDKKKALVEFGSIELSPEPVKVDPWLLKDDVVRHADNPWVQALNKQLDRSDNRNVCIFVHGYNTNFIENTLLAAEIFHYTGRQGAMISFEWPSESNVLGYIADKGNATFSTRHFRGLISNLAKECEIDTVTIIAHSAGTPIVVNALRELRLLEHDLPADEVREKYRIGRVVLAAPDMDLMEFVNAIHDRFFELAEGIAVYASPNDKALGLSQVLYDEKRLGRSVGKLEDWEKGVLLAAENIEMIDASRAEKQYTNFLGHSYFHRDPWVSSDIGAFILGRSPTGRDLVRESEDVFWKFPSDYPARLAQRVQ